MIFNKEYFKQEQPYEQILKSPIYPCHPSHDWTIIFQLFFPTYMGSHSGYGISVGWQREIGIWNVAVLVILLAVNLKYDWFYLRAVLIALILGGLGIGTNHFLSYLQYHHSVNAVGAFENYLLVLGWIVGWWLENASRKTV